MSDTRLRVLALAPYPEEAPSTRVRISQYREALVRRGIDLHVGPFFSTDAYRAVKSARHRAELAGPVVDALADVLTTLRAAADYDVVWVQRGVAPLLDPWALDALRRTRVPLVYDFDDAVYLPQEGGRVWVERFRSSRSVTADFCRAAHAIFAGNAGLADFARSVVGEDGADRVHVIPSVVDTDRLSPRPSRKAGVSDDLNDSVVVGWMGSDTTIRYLESLARPLAELSGEGTVKIVVVAGRRRPRLPGVDFSFVPWSQDREAELVRSLDIGLYPLDDTAWSRGKCGYKAIQYLAAGVPCVASPVGVLRDLVRPGETGQWAESPGAWTSAIRELARDGSERARMARTGRDLVEAQYSLRAFAPIVADLLATVANQGSRA